MQMELPRTSSELREAMSKMMTVTTLAMSLGSPLKLKPPLTGRPLLRTSAQTIH